MKPQELYELNKQGKTFVELAEIVGITKNAIAGRIHRWKVAQGITERTDNNKKPRRAKIQPKITKCYKKKQKEIIQPYICGEPVAIMDLRARHCRYPINDGKPYMFCGEDNNGNESYCDYHHKMCHSGRTAKDQARIKRKRKLSGGY